jgi:mRNA interferase YafQ
MDRRGKDITKLEKVVDMLASGKTLPEKYRDHKLTGNWVGYRDCHIEPDWVLIYKIENDILILTLSRTGSHSDLL